MKVLCAIPALNEEVAIGSVVLRARRHVDTVVVVDDGSADRTAEVAAMAGAIVLKHPENRGKGEAYRTFWNYARDNHFDALVTLDGDGQHDADEIPLVLAVLQDHDVAIGARWGETTEMPLWRKVGKRVLDYSTAFASDRRNRDGPKVTDSQSGFRAYGAKALAGLEPRQAGFSVESQILIDAHDHGLHIGETRIHCRYDVEGSTLGSFTHASGVLNDILLQAGVRHPLLLLGLPGVIMALLGLMVGGWSIYLYESEGQFALGWVLLASLLAIIGVLGIFAGLLFNLLPRSVAEAVRKALPHRGH